MMRSDATHRKSSQYVALVLAFIFGTVSCTYVVTPPEPSDIPLQGFELYYSHSAQSHVEFEQFRFMGESLYAECGDVGAGANPPHVVFERKIISFQPDSLAYLKELAWSLNYYADDINVSLNNVEAEKDAPIDSGDIRVSIELSGVGASIIHAPFENTAGAKEEPEVLVRRFVHVVRAAVGETLCGRERFFGIETSK